MLGKWAATGNPEIQGVSRCRQVKQIRQVRQVKQIRQVKQVRQVEQVGGDGKSRRAEVIL
jgi:hypothetical protein